jgi:hypothetical protein
MSPDAVELDADAARLEALALEVGTALDRVVAFHRPDVWQGRRADRFGRELEDQRRQVRVAADELAAEARVLRARAELVRALPSAP